MTMIAISVGRLSFAIDAPFLLVTMEARALRTSISGYSRRVGGCKVSEDEKQKGGILERCRPVYLCFLVGKRSEPAVDAVGPRRNPNRENRRGNPECLAVKPDILVDAFVERPVGRILENFVLHHCRTIDLTHRTLHLMWGIYDAPYYRTFLLSIHPYNEFVKYVKTFI